MSIHADYDFDFDADLDEAAFAEQERAFEAFMREQGDLISEDDQIRYEEWCEGQDLDAAEDHWESYFDSLIPDEEW